MKAASLSRVHSVIYEEGKLSKYDIDENDIIRFPIKSKQHDYSSFTRNICSCKYFIHWRNETVNKYHS